VAEGCHRALSCPGSDAGGRRPEAARRAGLEGVEKVLTAMIWLPCWTERDAGMQFVQSDAQVTSQAMPKSWARRSSWTSASAICSQRRWSPSAYRSNKSSATMLPQMEKRS
jgi:hypothetical protein